MTLEEEESICKTCACKHSYHLGQGKKKCKQLEKTVEAQAKRLFGDGPELAGSVKAEYHYVSGWGLRAQKKICAETIIGGARCCIKLLHRHDFNSNGHRNDMDFRHTDEGLKISRGSALKDHTDTVMHPAETECVRLANVPRAVPGMLTWKDKQREKHVEKNHNACLLTVTNRPWYLLVACKDISKGAEIEAHYGPATGFLLGQYVFEKHVY